jgi:NAD(P)-dependent dehydrogenase (short-subunit alcohol dehydrogenase family)
MMSERRPLGVRGLTVDLAQPTLRQSHAPSRSRRCPVKRCDSTTNIEGRIMSLQGKTAIVTGGATGIGRAIAHALAKAGARVAVGGRRADKLTEAAAAFAGEQIAWRVCDVADRSSANEFIGWAIEKLGRIDILVNSAGANIKNRTIAEMRPEQWDELLAVNATGAYNCMAAALPGMRERKSGLIVNISSISGLRASKLGGVAYCASKFAMAGLGTAVSLEEADNGIRVSNVYPGEVDTPILAARPTPVTAEHRARILQPEDVAAAVLMIAELPPRAHVPELVIKPALQDFA